MPEIRIIMYRNGRNKDRLGKSKVQKLDSSAEPVLGGEASRVVQDHNGRVCDGKSVKLLVY